MIFVTGGAGFIGSNFVIDWLNTEGSPVINFDKLTYAGNMENLATLANDSRHIFVCGDINDRKLLEGLLPVIEPLHQKRVELEKDLPGLKETLFEGSRRARAIAEQTMDEVRQAMRIKY